MERNERALEAAQTGASEAFVRKALRGRKGRRALNELLCNTKDKEKVDDYAGLSPGSLEEILSSLPPPPEGASDKDYAAYAAAAAQYTQQAASALKLDIDTLQSVSNGNLNGNGASAAAASLGMGLPLLPGMEEAAALLRASGAVGPSSSASPLDTHSFQDSILEETLAKSTGVGLSGYGGCPLPGGPVYADGDGRDLLRREMRDRELRDREMRDFKSDRHYGAGHKKSGSKDKSALVAHGGGPGAAAKAMGASSNGQMVSFWDMDADKTEQEKLRAFWEMLPEDQRRDLVKIEKKAILREMKGPQKYICTCSVCGRRREVLEQELEMLYDAYYAELALDKKTKEIERRKNQVAMIESGASDAGGSSGQDLEVHKAKPLSSFYDNNQSMDEDEATLANSLTVRGDTLTVCDELLEDDGRKFFDLLLRIAESRYHYRDELSGLDASEFDDDDFDDLTDDSENDDDDDLTDDSQDEDSDYLEEQRMQEGRRMFQMFAARMIEQRLLVAYREKCALEAQEQLIREEEEAEREKEERQRIKKEKEKERKKKRKEQKKAQKAAGEAEKLRLQKLEEEAKLEAKRKKEVQEKKRKEEREQQRLKEERDRNMELARRREELMKQKKLEEDAERKKAAEAKLLRQKEERKLLKQQQQQVKTVKISKPKHQHQTIHSTQRQQQHQVPVPVPVQPQVVQVVAPQQVATGLQGLPRQPPVMGPSGQMQSQAAQQQQVQRAFANGQGGVHVPANGYGAPIPAAMAPSGANGFAARQPQQYNQQPPQEILSLLPTDLLDSLEL